MAYIALALLLYHPDATKPILYLVITVVYAGFAAYVAERARREAWAESQALDEDERERSDKLLLNVLPRSIADRKKEERGRDHRGRLRGRRRSVRRYRRVHQDVGAVCGRATWSRSSTISSPGSMTIADELGLEKIKTIGDCYMVACGLPKGASRRCRQHGGCRFADAAANWPKLRRPFPEDQRVEGGLQIRDRHPLRASRRRCDRQEQVHLRPLGRHCEHGEPDGVDRRAGQDPDLDRHARPASRSLQKLAIAALVPMKGKDMQEVWLLEGKLADRPEDGAVSSAGFLVHAGQGRKHLQEHFSGYLTGWEGWCPYDRGGG